MSTRTVLIAGGGTAGHVFPAIAVANELRRLDPSIEPVFVGTRDRLEGRLVPEAGYHLHHIDVLPLPRRPTPSLLKVPGALRRSIANVEALATALDVKAAVTFGGYVSLPVSWAMARKQLPLVIHEQNAIPGMANKLAARWADKIAVSFPGSVHRFKQQERVAITGNPVREQLLDLDMVGLRDRARDHFKLRRDLPTLLVFGGSQGSRTINRAVAGSLQHWRAPGGVQVLHSSGRALYDETAAALERSRRAAGGGPAIRLVDFIDEMDLAFAAADAVVSRAGATSIAELTVLGLPSLLVPYPHATADHQLHNARALERVGGGVVVEDKELTGQRLVEVVEPWLSDRVTGARTAAAALSYGRPDAARNVARLVLDQLEQGPGKVWS
ncbi:MAG: UDP-N-acetylglucosamine--N-acetylmuramyl-(pentapeptide) pyrophosphoryl-undecaprenol N-acetylglucosamine transferase [Nitriliruptoraceae bacterium]